MKTKHWLSRVQPSKERKGYIWAILEGTSLTRINGVHYFKTKKLALEFSPKALEVRIEEDRRWK